jgi:hypothetical protein
MSGETICAWRRRFGAMTADEAKRMKVLESENLKLKKMLADWTLELDVLKEINARMVSAPVRRRHVAPLRKRGLPVRRAWRYS